MTGYGQCDHGSLASRNIAVWYMSMVFVFSHIVLARCRVLCGYFAGSIVWSFTYSSASSSGPSTQTLEWLAYLSHMVQRDWKNVSFHSCFHISKTVLEVCLVKRTTFQKSTMYRKLLTLLTVCSLAHYMKLITAAFIRWSLSLCWVQ